MECLKVLGAGFGIHEDKLDGIMNAGGTASNLSALLLGRHHHFPHVRDEGW
jgi:glutamate/tyrosine decarboxylase-like PLP-dependent enzyme